MKGQIDISPAQRETVQNILRAHLPPGVHVWAFGSRAAWTAKDFSDLDLALEGAEPVSTKTLLDLETAFEESSLPWKVDVIDLNTVTPEFRAVVEAGKVRFCMTAIPEEKTLYELGEVNRGRSRHRPRNAQHLYGGAYPFIQTGDVKSADGIITSHTQTYNEAGLAQSQLWPKGTMLITIAANIAETAILTYPACFPDSIIGFVADREKADVRFVEYMFRKLKRQIQHENVGTGSVQDNINMETLRRLKFPVPPLSEQKAIASVLGALDDKIEANRRMNETLEAMARALFKSWFVDFDPVHAKAKGQTPTQINKKTATLFPKTFEENGLPTGWGRGQVSDLCMKIENGGTPKRSIVEYWTPGEMNWLASGEVRQPIIITTENRISKEGYNNSSAKLWPEHTIIVALYGATAGQVTYLAIPSTANQACCGLQAISEAAQYLYTVLALNTQQLE